MKISVSDLINKGEYWSAIARLDHSHESLEQLERLSPEIPRRSWKIRPFRGRRRATLASRDGDWSEAGR